MITRPFRRNRKPNIIRWTLGEPRRTNSAAGVTASPACAAAQATPVAGAVCGTPAVLVAVLLLGSISGSGAHHSLAAAAANCRNTSGAWHGNGSWPASSGWAFANAIRLRDLIGGRWASWDDFFLDILTAALFLDLSQRWCWAAGAKLMHLDQAGKIDSHAPPARLPDSEHRIWNSASGSAELDRRLLRRDSSFADICSGNSPR